MNLRLVLAALLAGLVVPAGASAKTLITADEALRLAFPGCRVERQTRFLTEAQQAEAARLAGSELQSAIAHPYVATCPDGPGGVAWFDVHRVRTLAETLMVVVDPDGRVRRVEVLAFAEPEDYLPRDAWYAQLEGRALGPELALGRGVRGIAGATLTARATTAAVRRALALHRVLISEAAATKDVPEKPAPKKDPPEKDAAEKSARKKNAPAQETP